LFPNPPQILLEVPKMLRALLLALMTLAIPPGSAFADGGADLGANAALEYWRAFATMPKFTDAEQNKLTAEYLTVPLDKATREIVGKSEYSLRLMHMGAALPRCAWGIKWEEEGVDALLPQMMAARMLTTLACLRARIRFEEGKNGDAVADVIAASTLGRQVSLDGSLIGVLVGYNIEARIGELIALQLPRLDPATIQNLRKRLNALPAGARPSVALRLCEEKTLGWFIRRVKATKNQEELLTFFAWVGLSEGKDRGDAGEKARSFLKECGGTAAGVIKYAEEALPSYEQLAGQLELPLDQVEAVFARELKARAGNPVFKVFFPAILEVRRSQARAEVRRALLEAAMAIQVDGRDALKKHLDPVAGGPFEYVPFQGGFELRSKYTMKDGKPITLTVGHRG
jgi:hypothetical protein